MYIHVHAGIHTFIHTLCRYIHPCTCTCALLSTRAFWACKITWKVSLTLIEWLIKCQIYVSLHKPTICHEISSFSTGQNSAKVPFWRFCSSILTSRVASALYCSPSSKVWLTLVRSRWVRPSLENLWWIWKMLGEEFCTCMVLQLEETTWIPHPNRICLWYSSHEDSKSEGTPFVCSWKR